MVPGCKVLVSRAAILVGLSLCQLALTSTAAASPLPTDITSDTTWTAAGSPYTVSTSSLTIKNGATLTIEPGVQVKIGTGLSIVVGSGSETGALWAVGTESLPITFKRSSTLGTARWASIHFTNSSLDSKSRLEHCLLDWGGATGTDGGAVFCQSASPSFANITIHQSKVTAIYLEESSPTFYGRIHQTGGASTGGGMFSGSSFSGGAGGPGQFGATEWLIYAEDLASVPTFVSPDLLSQGKFVRAGPRAWANLFNASPVIQGGSHIGEVLEGSLTVSSTWGDPGIAAFHLEGDLTVAGDSQSSAWPVLSMAAGSVWKLDEDKSIIVGSSLPGGLISAGTSTSPVTIEGKTIGLNLKAEWKHLRFNTSALAGQCRLEHTTIRDASGDATLLEPATLVIEGGIPVISDVVVEDNVGSGVYVNNAATTITNLTVDGFSTAGAGLHCRNVAPATLNVQMSGVNLIDGRGTGLAGVRLSASSPHLEGLTIAGITGKAIGGPASGSPDASLAPTFASITIASSVGSLGEGPPDLWANFFNSGPALQGADWIQEVSSGSLTKSTTWGGSSALAYIHLPNTLAIEGPESPMLTIAEGTQIRLDSQRNIDVGVGGPGGLQILGSQEYPVVLQPIVGVSSWGRIRFTGTSHADSRIEHCELRNCGGTNLAALDVSSSSPSIQSVLLTNCGKSAIRLDASSSPLANIQIDGFGSTSAAITISNSEGMSLTGSNVIRGGGSGSPTQRGIEIQGSEPPPSGPLLSGIDIDEIGGDAFHATTAFPNPSFNGIVVGPDVVEIGIGGPDFWANFINSNPTIQGTGYIQSVRGGVLGESTTWSSGASQSFSEIRLLGSITIDGAQPVLTLAPGSTVRLGNGVDVTAGFAGVLGAGGIVASGTSSQHIVFDSITQGQRWGTITILGPTGASGSKFEYCEFFNGGAGSSTTPALSLSSMDVALPVLRNLTFNQASNYAVTISAGTAGGILDGVDISNCEVGINIDQPGASIIVMNSTFDSITGAAIQAQGAGVSSLELIEDCVFTDCGQAVKSLGGGSALVFHQCEVSNWDQGGPGNAAVEFTAGSFPAILGSSFSGDGVVIKMSASAADLLCHPALANTYSLGSSSRVELLGDVIEAPARWTNDVGVPYRILGSVTFSAPLTIEHGVTIEVNTASAAIKPSVASGGAPIRVRGQLGSPVTFTPVGATWGGLAGGPNSVVEHAVIHKGGLSTSQGLQLTGPGVVRSTTISNSLGSGFVQQDDTTTQAMLSPTWLVDCTFTSNAGGGVLLNRYAWVEARNCQITSNLGEGGVNVDGESLKAARIGLRECSFASNSPRAISYNGVAADFVDARFCWWNHADGPSGGTQSIETPSQAKFDPWFGSVLGSFRISSADVDPAEFDPADSEVRWAGELSAAGTWSLEVRDSSSQLVHTASGTDSIDTSWDGADTEDVYAGSYAPDGTYDFVLAADETGGAMADSSLRGTVTLDSSGLVAEINAPVELTFVPGGSSLQVFGTAAGSQSATYVLEYGLGSDPADSNYTEAENDDTPVVDSLLGTVAVPTQAEQGILTVRLRTLNSGGTTSVAAVRPYRLHSIVTSGATPDPFSPNGDGFQDQTGLTASIAWPSSWEVDVVEQGMSTVLNSWTGAGTQIAILWDGMNTSQQVQPEGTYTFKITATETGSSTVATAEVDVELSLAEKAIEITAPTGASPVTVMGDVPVTMNVDSPSNEDFHWRLEHGPTPTWSLIASGSATSSTQDIERTWDSTQAPAGGRTLRASMTLADGTVHYDELDVDVVNPDVVLSTRVFDPLNGESTDIEVSHGTATPTGSVVVRVKQATVTPTYYWVGELTSIGSVVWNSSPQSLVAGSATVPWDGMSSPGVPATAGNYVVEAVVSYSGGGSATYSENTEATYAVDNSLLVSPAVAANFDPYYGGRVSIDFGLLEPAWVTMTYATGSYPNGWVNNQVVETHGLMKSVLYDGGPSHPGHTFEWDGRAVGRDGLAMGDGPVAIPNIRMKAIRTPRSLMTLVNRRELMEDPMVSPVAIHPLHGQVAVLTGTLPYDAKVTVKLFNTVSSGTANSEGTLIRTLLLDSDKPAGPFEQTIDGRDSTGQIPTLPGTYTVLLEVKHPTYTTFMMTRRLCLRILQ